MTAKDVRADIKAAKAAKTTQEQTDHAMGTTQRAFMPDCAMHKTMDIIRLNREESERFITVLQQAPEANDNLKQLFKITSR